MASNRYKYIIIGGGLAGGSAVEGLREIDQEGSILLVGAEKHLPYDRPPLTKQLWFGKKTVEGIRLHDAAYYNDKHVTITCGMQIIKIAPGAHTITDKRGVVYEYEKLLLATGGAPRRLDIPGGDLAGISYYRYLDDYLSLRSRANEGKSALVIGGGFIGSEIAAALNTVKVNVTMLFPDAYLVARVFPESLGRAIQEIYRAKGVHVVAGDTATAIGRENDRFQVQTKGGATLIADLLVVGVGIAPSLELAVAANLQTDNGIVVNDRLQTSNPNIYAAGDNAYFPYQALGKRMRVEHWDNAINQGKLAGRNMAGANEPYNYMPYFFSDLFEFGYEAVGEVDSRLEAFADWQKENGTGVIYYLAENKVRGAMMCNVWDRVSAARELIRQNTAMTKKDLVGAIS
jgi:3-phenylpropionate/trans-cinnamate dioxygenase ferredoxin reductase component